MRKLSIGIDYGTLSARGILVDTADGHELAEAVYTYPHGVIEGEYRGTPLERGWALQDPADYENALISVTSELAKQVDPAEIVGIGVDFTSATVLPVTADGRPLCEVPEFRTNPSASCKLWKHHSAQPEADELTELLRKFDPERLKLYGGRISSEWLFPKLVETLHDSPEVYAAMDRYIEAGDFIVWLLTGRESHSVSAAGYKALWNSHTGYPANELLARLDPRLDGVIGTKISPETLPLGAKVGNVCERISKLTGLPLDCAVGTAYIDAHAGLPGCGIVEDGRMLMVIGTSNGHILLSDTETTIPGICGVVDGGVIPGKYAYESGQAAVGDIFDWFVKNCVPERYEIEARERGIGMHKLLREKAKRLRPGESGLLALDWWNGNRTPYNDASLSGTIFGLTLTTKPEEIYRALLEATAYGARMIADGFEAGGVKISELIAAGGIAAKDELMMQIYADVMNKPIRLAESAQSPAHGSAVAGAVAAGVYPDLQSAAKAMGHVKDAVYTPIPENVAVYEKLYREFEKMADYFGRENNLMKRLREIAAR